MKVNITGVAVKGIAVALPKDQLDLLSFKNLFGEKEIKRISMSTGITSIRVAGKRTASELCLSAAKSLLDRIGLTGADVDGIIFVSQTPDQKMPATSIIMQHQLSMSNQAVAFDINYGCSGYVYGLYLASMLLSSGGCKRILLCAGDVITNFLDPKDQNVRLVFGDAGSATIIEKGNDEISFIVNNDGSGAEYLHLKNSKDAYFYMDGAKVMEFVLREVPIAIEEILAFKAWNKEDIGSFVFHQPNLFMLNYLKKKIKIPAESFPVAIEGIGNTGPASIPVVLVKNKDKLIQSSKLEKVILCGFGVGLSWGTAALNLSNTLILPFVEF